jgi:hypothetical protein
MKKFRANYGSEIKELEVIKETEKQIVFITSFGHQQRENKISEWCSWHDTKEAAVNHLISREQSKIDTCLRQIEYCKQNIVRIKSL